MKYFTFLCLLILTLKSHSTAVQTDEKSSQLPTVINSQILQNSLAASVQITSRAVENASSARTLGKVRQGSVNLLICTRIGALRHANCDAA